MGCCSSQPEDSIATKAVQVETNASTRTSKDRHTSYHSDVDNEHAGITTGLIHRADVKQMHHKYDTSKAAELGHGACGSVIAVRRKDTGDMFAMKTVALDMVGAHNFDELRKEIDVQKKMDHPNIAKILEYFEDPKHGVMHIVMELCAGGSLVSRMKDHRHGYSERSAATLMERLLSAVTYCHHHGIVHRDIKLDNIMYESDSEESELKLIDFGFATEVRGSPLSRSLSPSHALSHRFTHRHAPRAQVKRGSESMFDQLGTPSYMAPELWSDRGPAYDSSVDVWAVGVVTYMLLCGRRPWDHPNRDEKRRMIRHDKLQFPSPAWDKISSEAKDFCESLLQKRPADRLSAADAVKHPWIRRSSNLKSGLDAAHEMLEHEEIFSSLTAYEHADGLARLSLQVMAFATPPNKVEELRTMFHKIDTDDSGTISREEFMDAMSAHPELPKERVEQMFKALDFSGTGQIEYAEFIAATLASQGSTKVSCKNSIQAAFTTLDVDHDGFITLKDLHDAFSGQIDDAVAESLLKHRDASYALRASNIDPAPASRR